MNEATHLNNPLNAKLRMSRCYVYVPFGGVDRIRTYKFSQWQQIYSLPPSPIWILPHIAESRVLETQTFLSNILSREFPNLSGLLSIAEGKRIELLTIQLAQFSRLLTHHWVLPSFCTPSQIRTDTLQGLNLMPLPLGYWSMCSFSDSNRNLLIPKTNASTSWAKRANKKAPRNESGGFLKLLKLYLKRYTLSCQLFLNNLATMRDYINFVFSCRQIYDLILNTQIINAQNLLRSGFGITHNVLRLKEVNPFRAVGTNCTSL